MPTTLRKRVALLYAVAAGIQKRRLPAALRLAGSHRQRREFGCGTTLSACHALRANASSVTKSSQREGVMPQALNCRTAPLKSRTSSCRHSARRAESRSWALGAAPQLVARVASQRRLSARAASRLSISSSRNKWFRRACRKGADALRNKTMARSSSMDSLTTDACSASVPMPRPRRLVVTSSSVSQCQVRPICAMRRSNSAWSSEASVISGMSSLASAATARRATARRPPVNARNSISSRNGNGGPNSHKCNGSSGDGTSRAFVGSVIADCIRGADPAGSASTLRKYSSKVIASSRFRSCEASISASWAASR
ncbi:hypothetical protein BTM_5194 [Burkholderia thailandensis 34]|nr:hypothetical protein BTL_4464 [Burkholderia thailandensis H0587]AJY32503.1 hypothetical protein BTM_5194 [Burkholderia thailandensis 34]